MKRILAALLLLTLAAPAWGQDYDRGWAAYERGDYAAGGACLDGEKIDRMAFQTEAAH